MNISHQPGSKMWWRRPDVWVCWSISSCSKEKAALIKLVRKWQHLIFRWHAQLKITIKQLKIISQTYILQSQSLPDLNQSDPKRLKFINAVFHSIKDTWRRHRTLVLWVTKEMKNMFPSMNPINYILWWFHKLMLDSHLSLNTTHHLNNIQKHKCHW